MPALTGTWSTQTVAGHRCNIYEPAQVNEHGYVVLYLHGVHLGALDEHPVFGEQFDRFGLRVIAPITERSWWTDRICAEFDPDITVEKYVLTKVLPAIEEFWDVRPPRIALLGTSMGGQGALRFAFKHPDRFPIVAALSPAIDYQLRFDLGDETLPLMYDDAEAARQDTAILHIHPLYWPRNTWFCCCPTDDPWHSSADRLQMKLAALGIPHECDLETEGGGHGFGYYTKMAPNAIEYLHQRLEAERRRVI